MGWRRNCSEKYYIKRMNEISTRGDLVVNALEKLGLHILYRNSQQIQFLFKNQRIIHWIEKSWSSGKGIQDCRGLENLLVQLK